MTVAVVGRALISAQLRKRSCSISWARIWVAMVCRRAWSIRPEVNVSARIMPINATTKTSAAMPTSIKVKPAWLVMRARDMKRRKPPESGDNAPAVCGK